MDWNLSVTNAVIFPVFWGLIRTPPEKRDLEGQSRTRRQNASPHSRSWTISWRKRAILRTMISPTAIFRSARSPIAISGSVPDHPPLPNVERWYRELLRPPGVQGTRARCAVCVDYLSPWLFFIGHRTRSASCAPRRAPGRAPQDEAAAIYCDAVSPACATTLLQRAISLLMKSCKPATDGFGSGNHAVLAGFVPSIPAYRARALKSAAVCRPPAAASSPA